jgi:hypothetical protein
MKRDREGYSSLLLPREREPPFEPPRFEEEDRLLEELPRPRLRPPPED